GDVRSEPAGPPDREPPSSRLGALTRGRQPDAGPVREAALVGHTRSIGEGPRPRSRGSRAGDLHAGDEQPAGAFPVPLEVKALFAALALPASAQLGRELVAGVVADVDGRLEPVGAVLDAAVLDAVPDRTQRRDPVVEHQPQAVVAVVVLGLGRPRIL